MTSASPPIGGTFDINFQDGALESVAGVKSDVEVADLVKLLEDVDGIDKVNGWRSGDCSG